MILYIYDIIYIYTCIVDLFGTPCSVSKCFRFFFGGVILPKDAFGGPPA